MSVTQRGRLDIVGTQSRLGGSDQRSDEHQLIVIGLLRAPSDQLGQILEDDRVRILTVGDRLTQHQSCRDDDFGALERRVCIPGAFDRIGDGCEEHVVRRL